MAAVLAILAGIGLGIVTASGAFDAATATPPSDTPQTVVWEGNGTTNGFCSDNTATPGGGQDWLFILTSPAPGPWVLTFDFQSGETGSVDGVQQGDGSIHFDVVTAFGDQLLTASATNGTANSVLTVSHCTSATIMPPTTSTTTTTMKPPGPPPTTTPTTVTTTPSSPPTTTKPPTTLFVPAPQVFALPTTPSAGFTG